MTNIVSYMAMPGMTEKPPMNMPTMAKAQDIIDTVCNFFGCELKSVAGKRRNRELVACRNIIYYFLRSYTQLSLKEIGSRMGHRDHTTVMHGLQSIKNLIETEDHLRMQVDHIRTQLT